MKKIVALGAIAAIAGGMMFAEPEFAPSVTLDGSATAKWGVDLDAGQTGFTNETSGDFKVTLWGEGTRELEAGDDVWAELKVTGKEFKLDKGKNDGGDWELNEAKLHIGDFYVGIKSGDTQVGEYKFDAAIRSADNDNAKWLTNVGPADFSQGIVAGYGNDNFDVAVDFRSYYKADSEDKPYVLDEEDGKIKKTTTKDGTNTHYTSAYAFAAEAKLKDSNEFVEGLFVDAGVAYNISNFYATKGDDDSLGQLDSTNYFGFAFDMGVDLDGDGENEKIEIPGGAGTSRGNATKVNTLGYAFNAGYKFKLDDTYYVKPVAGLTGTNTTAKGDGFSATANQNNLVAGVLFGWGETKDANAGVYFLNDDDQTKKVTPGISVIAAIPLATKASMTNDGETGTATVNSAISAIIVPSVYLGDLVENLKFAAYSELAALKYVEPKDMVTGEKDSVINLSCANKDRTFALAFAAGVAYDVKVDDITVTPKAGLRYANAAYFENGINKVAPLSNKAIFENGYGKMGVAGKDAEGNNDYFNLKLGCDVAGLINNTTFFAEYSSANLLNDNEYTAKGAYDEVIKYYNIKNGTFDVGCKISF